MKDSNDLELIDASLKGDRKALEDLIKRYQDWIYNIAFRMVLVPEDAEDITQEIIIKMMTKLSTFDPAKGNFRTWLYRIVANHVLNMKTRGYEKGISSFEAYYSTIAEVPDQNPESIPDAELLIQDIMIGCVLGTMLCLDRKQRLVFILAVIFDVPDAVGSEVLGITKANFRKILSRARSRLFNYMHGNCGVLNKQNPCRCRNKAKAFMEHGWHTPERITFVDAGAPTVLSVLAAEESDLKKRALSRVSEFNKNIYSEYVRIFRNHPFYRSADLTQWLLKTLDREDLKELFETVN